MYICIYSINLPRFQEKRDYMKTKTRENEEIEKECNNYTLIDDQFRFYLLSTFKIIIDR